MPGLGCTGAGSLLLCQELCKFLEDDSVVGTELRQDGPEDILRSQALGVGEGAIKKG